jgi:hypothetical protein
MGSNRRYPSGPHPAHPVSTEALQQVEPPDPEHGWRRPLSLTPEELGHVWATMAESPIGVMAWVRYPAQSVHVRGRALAWTPRAVYVEWEDKGLHRTWVWASAVSRR